MGIVYHGKLEGLAKEVAEAKAIIDNKYIQVLGAQRAQQLNDAAKRLLTAESYFGTTSEWNTRFGERLSTLPADTSNKMMLLAASEDKGIDPTGKVRFKKIRTGVAFYISEEGFANSGSAAFTDRSLASYVHEYDHFVWYVLQKVPFYAVNAVLTEAIQLESASLDLPEYEQRLMEKKLSQTEIAHRLSMALYIRTTTEMHEKSNRILDKIILKEVGIDVPLAWRGEPRTYALGVIPPQTFVQIPTGGDPFKNLDDKEVIERVLNWENTLKMPYTMQYFQNVVNSVKEIKASRLSLIEFLALEKLRKGRR